MTFSAANLKLYAETQTLPSSFALVVLYIKTDETQKTLLLIHKTHNRHLQCIHVKINKQSRTDPVGSPRNEAGKRHTGTV